MIKKTVLTILSLISCVSLSLYAGTFQGGGGGPQNVEIRQYLDKRHYALDGGARYIAPDIQVVNACKHKQVMPDNNVINTLNTINKVWVCDEYVERSTKFGAFDETAVDLSYCKNRKAHVQRMIPEDSPECELYQTVAVPGNGIEQVCTKYKANSKPFPLTYKLDVYRRSIGDGGTHLYPNKDYDSFVRTIKYKIPDCLDVTD